MIELLQRYQQQPVEGEEDMSPERMSRSSRLSGRRRQSGARGEEAEGEEEGDLVKTKNKSTWWRSPFRSPSPSTEQIVGEVGKETWMAKKKEILNEESNQAVVLKKEIEDSEGSEEGKNVAKDMDKEDEKREVEGKGKGKMVEEEAKESVEV